MNPIKTALIGYGKIAHLHAQALAQIAEADFRAVWGRDASKAGVFAQQYNVQAYTDLEAMLDREQIEAVIVTTPHPAHADPTLTAIAHGAHALVEKPLAITLADCDAMIAAAEQAGVKLGVISQRRFQEPVLRMRNAIDAGKIGTPILGSVIMYNWRDQNYYESDPWRGTWKAEGGGVLVNQAPHPLDLLLWFMGDIDSLYGQWANLNHPYIEVEDTAVAVLRFKNGGLGTITVSNSQKPGIYAKVHIHGSNGASVGVQPEGGAMFVPGMIGISEAPFNDLWTIPGEAEQLPAWQAEDRAVFAQVDAQVHYLMLQNQDFLRAIREDRDPAVTGRDGRRVVELFTAIYRSQQTNAPVQFPLEA